MACIPHEQRHLNRSAALALRQGVGGACLWLLTDGRTLESPPAPQAAQPVRLPDCR